MSVHHNLDPYPIPKESQPLYVNEPWLIDPSREPELKKDVENYKQPEAADDNVRIYVPLDLNHDAILRRLDYVIGKYGEASEANEFYFSGEVDKILSQLEIYDQKRFIKNLPKDGSKHSTDGKKLAADIITKLEEIEDAGAETFPFELIDELKAEYLGE